MLVTGDSSSPSFGQSGERALGEFAAIAGLSFGSGSSYGLLAEELSQRCSVLDAISDKLGVVEEFGIEKSELTNAVLREDSLVTLDSSTGLLIVSFEHIDRDSCHRGCQPGPTHITIRNQRSGRRKTEFPCSSCEFSS